MIEPPVISFTIEEYDANPDRAWALSQRGARVEILRPDGTVCMRLSPSLPRCCCRISSATPPYSEQCHRDAGHSGDCDFLPDSTAPTIKDRFASVLRQLDAAIDTARKVGPPVLWAELEAVRLAFEAAIEDA